MKLTKFIALLFCLICLDGWALSQAKEVSCADANREFSVSPGQKLTIDAESGGAVQITGWNENRLKVQTHGDDDSDCTVEFDQNSRGIEIKSHHDHESGHHQGVDFEISLPSHFDISVQTMGGNVTIQNVDGHIEGQTMGGKLRFSELKGIVDFTTMGGGVDLTDSSLDGSVHTMGGNVSFVNVSGSVKGTSMGGKVTYENSNGKEEKISGEVHMTTMGGDLDVSKAPEGAYLHTMGGDIHIASANDHVKAETMGGNIQVDSVDGWISAKTMGGDITAKMVGDASRGKRDVDLTSMGGDIELTVPAALGMDFDLELAFTEGRSGRYRIESDFPLKQEETKEWETRYGTSRKYIYGTGKVGSGANRIRIHTINGNIIIKKS